MTDATQREQIFYKTLFESVGEAIIACELDGTIIEWNAVAEEIYGWKREEVIGKALSAVLPTEYEEGQTTDTALETLIRENVWRGKVIQPGHDGRKINIASTVRLVLDPSGQPYRMVGLNRDITESKKTGVMLQRLENLNRAITRDLSLNLIFQNFVTGLEGLIPFDFVALTLVDLVERTYTLKAVWGLDEEFIQFDRPVSITEDTIALLRPGRLPLVIADIHAFPQISPMLPTGLRVSSMLTFPLYSGLEPLGVLAIGHQDKNIYTQKQGALLSSSAEVMAIALRQARLLEETQSARHQLEDLSLRLLRTQEAERAVLARELHDHLGQELTVLRLNLQSVLTAPEMAPELVPSALDLTGRLMEQVHDMSVKLHPPILDILGLAAALHWYLHQTATVAGLETFFSASEPFPRMARDVELAFYRINQEAVTNILRHAQARHVWVDLSWQSPVLRLQVRDDGQGFSLTRPEQVYEGEEYFGLRSMTERAKLLGASLRIETAPGSGTCVVAEWRQP